MQSINPYDESVLATYEFHFEDDVRDALFNRRRGNRRHVVYRPGSIVDRKQRLLLVAKIFRERADQLAVMMTKEMGKPIGQSQAEVEKSAACCEYYAEHAEQMLQPQVVQTEASYSEIRFEPMGTILAIMPWNFPVWQVVRCAAPALMAGNRILLKHALNVCGCAEMIQAVFDDSFGEMAVCNIRVSHEDAASLIQTQQVQAVTLTGSEQAGSKVGKVAGEAIIKCVMELGGVDPFIVLEDADIETTVAAAVRSRILNNGQSCIAAKRFILMKSIADEFTECFVEQMKQLKMGDPMDPKTELGPLARKDLRDSLHEQVIFQTEQKQSTLLCGGVIPDRPGWFYPPTVISQNHVDTDNHIRETFGPVAMLEVNRDDEVPMSYLCHSEYGLGASIWTQDIDRARRIASGLRCGSVFVNEITKSDPRLPFGGVGKSGYGRELSEFGLREFTNVKSVWIN